MTGTLTLDYSLVGYSIGQCFMILIVSQLRLHGLRFRYLYFHVHNTIGAGL